MWRTLFLSIIHKLIETSLYFSERYDATGRIGLTTLQKCTTVVRQLAYGMAVDMIDEYLKLGKSTALEYLEYYYACIIECFRAAFLRYSTVADTQRLLAKAKERGFPGMLGSIDCMHWQWHNCLVGWQGQFTQGDIKHPTIILEVVASHDRWIWHVFLESPILTTTSMCLICLHCSLMSKENTLLKCHSLLMVMSITWDTISLMVYIPPGQCYERCACSSTREASILLNKASIGEKRCGVCIWPTKEEVQHTSYPWLVLLSAHSRVDHACLHYLVQHDHRQ
jgi:hypothetical protein